MMTLYTQVTIRSAPILGTFSKAKPGGVALNYGESSGPDCDTDCPYHAESTSAQAVDTDVRCYAYEVERRYDRENLRNKLHRHQVTNRESITTQAHQEVRRRIASKQRRIPWFRFSAFGSVPRIPPKAFRPLCEDLEDAQIDVHLPVESWAKTRRYRKELKGLNIAVRRSCHSVKAFLRASIRNNPISVVVGTMDQTPAERIAESKRVAAARTARTNRKTVVCPAVASTHLRTRSDKAKCGWCDACAKESIDIVYPAHK